MEDLLIYTWLGLSGVVGYGAAFFFAFFALDDPRTPPMLQPVVYIIAWFFIGTVLSLAAAVASPFMMLFSGVVFLLEIIQKSKTH